MSGRVLRGPAIPGVEPGDLVATLEWLDVAPTLPKPVTVTRFLPARLDVAAFARAQATLEGVLEGADLPRLADVTIAPADGVTPVSWRAQGLWRQPLGAAAEIRIRLQASATVWQTCQRCLEPVSESIEVDRTLRFVAGEDEAARLDEESEEDVLALTRTLDLPTLVEDELILALPIVPRHVMCPRPLDVPAGASGEVAQDRSGGAESNEHPFAVLQSLKRR